MRRKIADILKFRGDISPFLAHLTRDREEDNDGGGPITAADSLRRIITERRLVAGSQPISDAKWGIAWSDLPAPKWPHYFSAISFTETPIAEIHCMLDVAGRRVNLAPFGLVFLKERLANRGIAPVIYLNNLQADVDPVVGALCSLIKTHPDEAARFLPLISFFGTALKPKGGTHVKTAQDFRWEREWRFAHSRGAFEFDENDVFVGLCLHKSIDEFEALFPPVLFIDPRRNMKWYATRLVQSRRRLSLKDSVV